MKLVDSITTELVQIAEAKGYTISSIKITYAANLNTFKLRFRITPYPVPDGRRGDAKFSMYGTPDAMLKRVRGLETL